MQRALSLSRIKGLPTENENEEEDLRKAIMASQNDEEEMLREQQREEEFMLQKALSMSVLETRNEKDDDEEEEMLRTVLSHSVMDYEEACSSSEMSRFQNADQELEESSKVSTKDYSYSASQSNYDHSP